MLHTFDSECDSPRIKIKMNTQIKIGKNIEITDTRRTVFIYVGRIPGGDFFVHTSLKVLFFKLYFVRGNRIRLITVSGYRKKREEKTKTIIRLDICRREK